jgi:A nuclease family of the HNH/ENDO VII superfamily with conserved AHH
MVEEERVVGIYVGAKSKLESEQKPVPIWDIKKQKEFQFKLDSKPDPKVKWVSSSGENFYKTSIINQDKRPGGFINIPSDPERIILAGPMPELDKKQIIIGGGQDLTPKRPEIPVNYPVEEKITIFESRKLNEKDLEDPRIVEQIEEIKKDFGVDEADYRIQKGIVTIPETQDHHIIHQVLHGHDLIKEAEFDIDDLENRILLPTKKGAEIYEESKRTIHEGKHDGYARDYLKEKMDKVMKDSENMNWSQEKYRQEISKIIIEERKLLESGERALNKNYRSWAKINKK